MIAWLFQFAAGSSRASPTTVLVDDRRGGDDRPWCNVWPKKLSQARFRMSAIRSLSGAKQTCCRHR